MPGTNAKCHRCLGGLFVLLIALLAVTPGFAFTTSSKRWTPNRTVVMHLSLGGPVPLEDGFTSFNESAQDALNIWNTQLVHLQFGSVIGSALPAADGDGDNSVVFDNTIYGDTFGNGTLAVTLTSSRGNTRTECDVIFNIGEDWNSYRGPRRLDTVDFHRVALHEFGHVLGLGHPDEAGQTVFAIMNSRITSVDALQPDDTAGARSLYDSGPAYLFGVPAPNLVNLSTRAPVGTGNNVLIGGFIVQGSQPATVILRAIGHSLAGRGVNAPLDDTFLELRGPGNVLIAENDDWFDGSDAATIASYRLDPSNSLESAVIRSLAPGNYTVLVRAFDNGDGNLTGTGLVEIYDLHTTNGRAGNIATRGQVLAGNDAMIAGFIIGGGLSKEVIVRALGPSLAATGIPNALADPTLALFDSSGNQLAANDNWQSDANANRVQSSNLAPSQPVEAALYGNLNPGAYTAIVRGRNGGTGVGLIEVYDLSQPPN